MPITNLVGPKGGSQARHLGNPFEAVTLYNAQRRA